jgi:hypothetical protein
LGGRQGAARWGNTEVRLGTEGIEVRILGRPWEGGEQGCTLRGRGCAGLHTPRKRGQKAPV